MVGSSVRYGPDAAEITIHATDMATQSATAAMRLRTGGVKTIAQRVARHTALGFARQAVYGQGGHGVQGHPPKQPAARPQVMSTHRIVVLLHCLIRAARTICIFQSGQICKCERSMECDTSNISR